MAHFPQLLIPPSAEPVSVHAAKKQVRQDFPVVDDGVLRGYLRAARVTLEQQFGMSFVAQTLQATAERFPHGGGYFGCGEDYGGYGSWWNRGLPRSRREELRYPDRQALRVARPPFLLLAALNYLDPSGTPQMIETALSGGVAATGTQTVTPADMTGIYAGTQYSVADPVNPETITVSAVTATTFTAAFACTHPVNTPLSVYVSGTPAGFRFLTIGGGGALARIAPAFGQRWPLVRHQLGSIKLTWGAGYGSVTKLTVQTAAGTQTVTPANMAGIYPGSVFWIDADWENGEQLVVASTTPTTFTANFLNTHGSPAWINAVPESIQQAILMLVGHWFVNRESVGTVGVEVADGVESLMASARFAEYG